MTKRKLDENEIKICERNLKVRGENIKYFQYQIKYYELMLNEGLEQNYLRMIKEFKDKKREFEAELKAEEGVVNELKLQMEEGVEIKEITPVEESKDEGFKKYC